jgi:hypothetical protein
MRLFLRDIEDELVRENFRRIEEFLSKESKLAGFVHMDIAVDRAVTKQKAHHGLGFVPLDVIRTRITGSGDLIFNYSDFDEKTITFTTDGPVRLRAFVGTYRDTRGGVLDDPT